MGFARRTMNTTHRLLFSVLFVCVMTLLGSPAQAWNTNENGLKVGTGSAKDDGIASVPLYVNAKGDVQGFVMSFDWDGDEAQGVDLIPNDGAGKPLNGADLVVKRVADAFMLFSVVMDTDGQDGEKIPAAQNIQVGTAKIRCLGPEDGTRETPIKFNREPTYAMVDGGPLLANMISIAGRSIGVAEGLVLRDGKLTCEGVPEDEGIVFACGGQLAKDGTPADKTGARESAQTVTFYYKAPDDGTGNKNKIQGFSMSVAFDCGLTADEDSFDIEDGALEETNAEFVHLEVDNLKSSVDDDDCEFTVGVLVDAVAPFDGRTLPPTSTFKKLFSLDFEIDDAAKCGECLDVEFEDGLNGNGQVAVFNLVSVNFLSRTPKLESCSVCVNAGAPKFIRGDCNFSNIGRKSIDIADAAAAVGHIFLKGDAHFETPCQDACDANDDGKLDAADVVFILSYLFVPKSSSPPAPGPISAGVDPTSDDLTCEGGTVEC